MAAVVLVVVALLPLEGPSMPATITVLCPPRLLDLLAPARTSPALDRFGDLVHIAEFPVDALLAVSQDRLAATGGWWREIGRANVEVPYLPEEIREAGGVFAWLCDEIGASTERNVAACLGSLAESAGMHPVDLADHLAALNPDHPIRRARDCEGVPDADALR